MVRYERASYLPDAAFHSLIVIPENHSFRENESLPYKTFVPNTKRKTHAKVFTIAFGQACIKSASN